MRRSERRDEGGGWRVVEAVTGLLTPSRCHTATDTFLLPNTHLTSSVLSHPFTFSPSPSSSSPPSSSAVVSLCVANVASSVQSSEGNVDNEERFIGGGVEKLYFSGWSGEILCSSVTRLPSYRAAKWV